MKSFVSRWLFVLLLVACSAGAAHAQGTNSSIEGVVTDEAGATLPGANVVAVHEPTGTQYGAATNAEGRYRILQMRVGGPYTITVSFVGYVEETLTDVQLTLGQTRALDFELAEATAELEGIEVTAEADPLLNSSRTGAATNIDEETIEDLPTISRGLADFARLTPQSGGGYNLAGRNERYNNIQIDGATLNDVFGLGEAVPGSQAGAQPISLDAIQEFNVELAPYDVRYSGFTGGLINAITKSGSNDFEGSLRYRRGGDAFVGDLEDNAFGDFSENLLVGTFGGPVIEDKLFFFVNAEVKREGEPQTTPVGPSPGAPNAFVIDDATLDALGFESSEAVLEEVIDIAQNQYGYDPGGFQPFTERQDNVKFFAKLDWNIAPGHRLTARHNYVDAIEDTGPGRGNTGFDLGARAYVFESTQNSSTMQLNSTLGPNMYNEARLVYTRIRDERVVEEQPFPDVTLRIDPTEVDDYSVQAGIGRFNQANRLGQDLFEFTNNFTYIWDEHTITLGTSNQAFAFENLFIQDFYGTYIFDDFELEDGTVVTAIEAFREGRPTEYLFSYSLVEGEQAPVAEFTGYQFGFYAQDEWQVLDDLNLTFGLRMDIPYLPKEPSFNPDIAEVFPEYSTTNTASGLDNALWSPRFGFNYSFGGEDGITQLRGGTGIFSGRPPFVWISNQYSNTGVDFARIDAFFDDPAALESGGCFSGSADPADQPRPGDPACAGLDPLATTEVNLISDDFTYPQVWRTDLAIDQELPGGLVATLEGIYTSSINEVLYENINLNKVDPSAPGALYPLAESAYGRPLYGAPQTFGSERNVAGEQFTNVLLLKNADQGYEYNVTAQLQRNVPIGLGGSLSYTYSRAENVNNATSSRAISNWQFNENLDINDPRLGTADFEVRHRVLAYGSYRFGWENLFDGGERLATTVGFVLDAQAGEPFSWIYFGDANADGQSFNDLIYVPETETDVFLTTGNWDLLDAYIESEPSLQEARGTVVNRNTANAPWSFIFDLQLTQEILTFGGQSIEINATLENLFAFADDKLGLENEIGRAQFTNFNNISLLGFEEYITPEDVDNSVAGREVMPDDVGKPVINFSQQQVTDKLTGERFATSDFFSRWRARIGLRYTF